MYSSHQVPVQDCPRLYAPFQSNPEEFYESSDRFSWLCNLVSWGWIGGRDPCKSHQLVRSKEENTNRQHSSGNP